MIGCATSRELAKDYTLLEGIVIFKPVLEKSNERMVLYIRHLEGTKVCITQNEKNEKLLKMLATRINIETPVIL